MINTYLSNNYPEVDFECFYRALFPVGSFEQKGVFEKGKYNGIAIQVGHGEYKVRRYTVTDDLDVINELVSSDDFCLMSPISYIGKSRISENARYMYALAIDLDGVTTEKGMRFFLNQCENGHNMLQFVWGLPKPTYLVSSGTGIHIYYVFEKPVALFPSVVKELEKLKRRLTWQAWTQGASSLHDNVQYESLFQGFRMVGSITKVGTRVRAFKVGDKVTVEYLNKYVPEQYQANNMQYYSALPLKKAKELYPEWYERRVVNKQPKGTWQCKRDLYDWWIHQIKSGAKQGHRYWCIMTLATYAIKCGIEYDELEKDSFDLIPFMNSIGTEPFTEDDVIHALESYNDSYISYPIHTIIERTAIPIQKNKRNGRTQEQHIQIMNAIRDIEHPNGSWREGNGRKPKKDIVKQWQADHPNGKKIQCERETGLSRHTVLKWWD